MGQGSQNGRASPPHCIRVPQVRFRGVILVRYGANVTVPVSPRPYGVVE